jgi:hypothetical protein
LDLAENEKSIGVKRFLDAYSWSHDEVSNGVLLLRIATCNAACVRKEGCMESMRLD